MRVGLEHNVDILTDSQRILDEVKRINAQSFDESQTIRVGKELEMMEEQQARPADVCSKVSLPHNVLETKSEELSQRRRRLEAENRVLLPSRPERLDFERSAATVPDAVGNLASCLDPGPVV